MRGGERPPPPAPPAAKHHAARSIPAAVPAASGYADSEIITDSAYATLYKNSNPTLIKTELDKKKFYQDSLQYFSAEKNPGLTINATPVIYSGRVLDFQNRPVAGAFLAFKSNTGVGTTTDERGQFRLTLRQPDTTRQLTVSMIGFNRASLDLNELSTVDEKFNVIHLKPSTTNLDEVVVVGYGTHRKATEVAPPSDSDEKLDTLWTNAAPVVGSQAYLQYLDAAKKKLGLDSTIRGTETISFLVSRSGSMTGFKIEHSISPAHDAGIIRLVTDGPAWRIRHGRNVRAAVTVNF